MVGKKKKTPGKASGEAIHRELAALVTSSTSIRLKVKTIIRALEAAADISGKLLYLATPQADRFISFSFGGGRKRELTAECVEGIASVVRDTGKAVITRDCHSDPRYSSRVDIPVKERDKALAAFPLRMDKTMVGILELVASSFTRAEMTSIDSLIPYLTMACAHTHNLARIKELTITDELTGLFNARHLARMVDMEVRRSQRYGGIFSVIFIDLDNFKNVNDRHGHLVGSRVLQEVGRMLDSSLRADIDTAYRYGGDEFVLVLPNTDPEGAMAVAKRIQHLVKSRVFRDDKGVGFSISASFGIANFPRDAQSREDIIRMADEAMYRVKSSGRDGISIES